MELIPPQAVHSFPSEDGPHALPSQDGMAMRMMLLRNVMGASTYHYHTEQTMKTVRATAEGKTSFQLKEVEKLKTFSERLGVNTNGSINELALRLCDFCEWTLVC